MVCILELASRDFWFFRMKLSHQDQLEMLGSNPGLSTEGMTRVNKSEGTNTGVRELFMVFIWCQRMSVCPETWVHWAGFLTRRNKAFLQLSKTNPGWLFSYILLDICTSSVLQCSKFRRAIPESWRIVHLATCSYIPPWEREKECKCLMLSCLLENTNSHLVCCCCGYLWFIVALRKQRGALAVHCSEFHGQLCSLQM